MLFGPCPSRVIRQNNTATLYSRMFPISGYVRDSNEKWTLVADILKDGDTSLSFWKGICKTIEVTSPDWTIRVQMGNVQDYFKGLPGANLCDVLTGASKFLWSATEQGPYIRPSYFEFVRVPDCCSQFDVSVGGM